MSMNSGSIPSAPQGHESFDSNGSSRLGDDRQKSSEPEDQGDGQAEDSRPPPSSSTGGTEPAPPSGDNAQESTLLAQHDNRTSDPHGCERMTEDTQPRQNGTTDRVCAEHDNPAVTTEAVTRPALCEYAGCNKTPRYGTQDGPPIFCQAHKRAGQYTVRNGELFVATRDGRAFREDSGNKATGAEAAAVHSSSAPTAATTPPQEVEAPSSLPVPKSTVHSPAVPTAAATPPQEVEAPSPLSVPSAELCEETGCDVEPTYGAAGSGKSRFCSRHKKKSHVSLSNVPCLFPGCDIRPRYGLSMGKPVYCVTHKKKEMVHLLKEAEALEKEAHARKRRKSRLHAAEKKDRQEPKDDTREVMASAEKPVRGHKEGGGAKGTAGGKGKGPARGKDAASTQVTERKAIGKASRLSVTSPSISSTPAPSIPPASAQAKQISPKAEALPPSGLAPSDEMRLFQEAREAARVAAEASGSGRRARAPSRKCLEASGKMVAESIQWMTKEKREEAARLKMEMKEQRKAAAAAGLKFGHYLEAIAVPSPVGDRDGTEVTGIAGGGALSGGEGVMSNVPGQNPTPAKIGRADGEPTAVEEGQQSLTGSAGTAAEASSGAITDEKDEEKPPSVATEEIAVSKRKPKRVVSAGGSTARKGLTVVEGDGKRKSKRSKTGGAAVKAVVCESKKCSETATFGVNGTVRYCEEHCIYGMYKIIGGY